jgi:hypothetical protein
LKYRLIAFSSCQTELMKGFRRIKGHADIPALVAALENYEQGTEELCRLRPEEETGTRGH